MKGAPEMRGCPVCGAQPIVVTDDHDLAPDVLVTCPQDHFGVALLTESEARRLWNDLVEFSLEETRDVIQ